VGSSNHKKKGQSSCIRISGQSGKIRKTATNCIYRAVPKSIQRADRNQRCTLSCWARTIIAKKKDALGLKGPINGHFKPEIRKDVVTIIKDSLTQGLSQKKTCEIFGITTRKFRRWANPKPLKSRTAWNKLLEHERQAIEDAAWLPELIGKPISHIYVYGHNTGSFYASLSTVYRVLKSKNLVKPLHHRKRTTPYVSAHELLDQGFSLLCYDGTQFRTNSGINVWAIPVMILPQRYLLHIGHSINSICSSDLTRCVKEAHALIPEHLTGKLLAHSDRGSAMKSSITRQTIKELLGVPVHFGRPHTPDDLAWIESFIKTLKYHREAPQSFALVDDILRWFSQFPDIYNNDPHSSLDYVTPLQTLSGQREVILNQRKQNLAFARLLRYTAWQTNQHSYKEPLELAMQPA
jgi:putative transposase